MGTDVLDLVAKVLNKRLLDLEDVADEVRGSYNPPEEPGPYAVDWGSKFFSEEVKNVVRCRPWVTTATTVFSGSSIVGALLVSDNRRRCCNHNKGLNSSVAPLSSPSQATPSQTPDPITGDASHSIQKKTKKRRIE
ncbi:hypothetical protein Droror1_Dr00023149 [Drosera rotundifolia]